mgnify:CR=1 FL=1
MTQKDKFKHKRLMLVSLVAVFVLPIIIAKVLIDSGMARDFATQQYGIIIEPAIDLNANKGLQPLTENGLSPSEWIAIYFETGGCQEICQKNITAMQNVKKVLGKDSDRLKIGIFTSEFRSTIELNRVVNLIGGRNELEELKRILSQRIISSEASDISRGVVVIDWRGYMMLYYPEIDKYGFKKDLSKLLRGSRIR